MYLDLFSCDGGEYYAGNINGAKYIIIRWKAKLTTNDTGKYRKDSQLNDIRQSLERRKSPILVE